MSRIHDAAVREDIKRRIRALTPTAQRRWGRMTPDQMLWHCSQPIDAALGNIPFGEGGPKLPLPRSWIAWLILKGPWPKGKTPTMPSFEARATHDFEEQRQRLLGLIDTFTARDIGGSAAQHPVLGVTSMDYQSQLQARHLDHHLTQFGV
jgi:hypothetical protein